MKNILKNIVLCLIGLVLMATMTTTVAAAPSMLITPSAVINEDADILPVTFTITNDGDTSLTDTYTITAEPSEGETVNILTSGTITLTKDVSTSALSSQSYTINLPVDGSKLVAEYVYLVNVDVTGDLGLSQDIDVNVFVTGIETPIAQWILEDIEFDDETYPEGTVELEVTLETIEDGEVYEDVTIEAWIEDANGDRLTSKDKTGEFNLGKLTDDDKRTRTLTLNIPENADEGEYYVVVRVEGESDGRKGLLALSTDNEITIERNDHSVKIIYFDYDSTVEAGETVDFAIGLLNNGREDETVKTRINIIGLDASQTSGDIEIQIDEYAPAYFSIAIPEDADADDYTVKVNVYNDEIDSTQVYTLTVTGAAYVPVGGLVVGVDATSKQIPAEGGVYLITLTNNEANTRTFTMEVTGASTWADYSVNPATVTVATGTSGLVSVFISPKEGVSGVQTFTVNIKEGATIADSVGLTAQISEAKGITDVITTSLQWLVAILIIVAVVLGIAWAFKREK